MLNKKFKIPGKPRVSDPNYAEALAKFWMIVASLLIALNLFFILTLVQMAPRLKIIAQVLTSPMNSLQFIQAEPFDSDISDKNLIEQMLIRTYLTNRYIFFPDEEDMMYRWGPYGIIANLSAPAVYEAFYKGLGEEKLKNLRQLEYTQYIDITRIQRLNDTWTVEFDIYKLINGSTSKTTRVAVLESAYHPAFKMFRTDYSNPYGFYISSYTDAEKKQ